MGALEAGAAMAALMAKDLEGNAVDIAAELAGSWAVILIYRGDW